MEHIDFILTMEQARDICNYYGKNMDDLDTYDICELLDKLIDESIFGNGVMR